MLTYLDLGLRNQCLHHLHELGHVIVRGDVSLALVGAFQPLLGSQKSTLLFRSYFTQISFIIIVRINETKS